MLQVTSCCWANTVVSRCSFTVCLCTCLTQHGVAGDQLLIPSEMDTDLEQLIKGGPFELSLAADRLGNDLFGINSGAQVHLTLTLSCARMLVQMTD